MTAKACCMIHKYTLEIFGLVIHSIVFTPLSITF